MSSASNKVANAQNFVNQIYSKRMPAGNKQLSTPLVADQFPVASDIIQEAFQYVIPSGLSWGSQMTFTIPRSVGSIYNLFLEFDMPTDSGVTYCPYTAVQLVQNYQLYVGNQLINCSGDAMFNVRQKFLEVHGREMYAKYACGTGANSGAAPGDKLFLVCDYPGSFDITIPGATITHDDSYSIPFPLNKCNSDMIVQVTLPNISDIVTSGTLPSSSLPQVKLWYQSIWSSDVAFNQVNNSGNAQPIHIPGYRLNEASLIADISPAINYLDFESCIQQGQMDRFLFRVSSAAQIAAKDYFTGIQVQREVFTVNGIEFHKTESATETEFRESNWIRQDAFIDEQKNPFIYSINGTVNPFSIPADEYICINPYRNNPRLGITTASTYAGARVKFTAVTKCDYIIDTSGTVMFYTQSTN